MSELEETLEKVARKVLGLPVEAQASLDSLKKKLESLPLNRKEQLVAPISVAKPAAVGPAQETGAGEVASELPSAEPTKGSVAPVAEDQSLLRRLRECEKKFRKKADEAEKLRIRLEKEQKAGREAESARGRALQEAAHLRKDLERLRRELEQVGKELESLRKENAALREDKKGLQERLREYEEQEGALKARVRELEAVQAQKEHLEAQLAQLKRFKEDLPEPFPPEALFRVLVLDYPKLGSKEDERLVSLIEGYRALLEGKEHPVLRHTNRWLLTGEPKGIVLVGLERLLLDLVNLPVARWLRVHAFRLEALLQQGERLVSPRLMEE